MKLWLVLGMSKHWVCKINDADIARALVPVPSLKEALHGCILVHALAAGVANANWSGCICRKTQAAREWRHRATCDRHNTSPSLYELASGSLAYTVEVLPMVAWQSHSLEVGHMAGTRKSGWTHQLLRARIHIRLILLAWTAPSSCVPVFLRCLIAASLLTYIYSVWQTFWTYRQRFATLSTSTWNP